MVPDYEVAFDGRYRLRNDGDAPTRYRITYEFPGGTPVLDDFQFGVLRAAGSGAHAHPIVSRPSH